MPTLAEVTPVDAAFFEKAGASPGDAAILAQQHNALAGRNGPDARASLAVATRNMPPPPSPLPAENSVTSAQAMQALDAHEAAQLDRTLDATFAPPANAYEYRFPASPTAQTDEEIAADNAVRGAFHAEAFPRFTVENLTTNAARNARTITSAAQADARISANQLAITRMYGADTAANLATVDRFLDDTAQRQPALKSWVELLRDRPYLLDPLDIDALLQFAKHRAGRR